MPAIPFRQWRAPAAAAAVLLIFLSDACPQQKGERPHPLSKDQEVSIRRAVYTGRVKTSMSSSTPEVIRRVLIVPSAVESAFKANRHGTLSLLLDIARGGCPQDAILATAYAVSLAENVLSGPLITDHAPDNVDSVSGETTLRDRFVKRLETLVAKVGKELDKNQLKKP